MTSKEPMGWCSLNHGKGDNDERIKTINSYSSIFYFFHSRDICGDLILFVTVDSTVRAWYDVSVGKDEILENHKMTKILDRSFVTKVKL